MLRRGIPFPAGRACPGDGCLTSMMRSSERCADAIRTFTRWKAGGFLVDDDIVSMYPDLGRVIESLDDTEDAEG